MLVFFLRNKEIREEWERRRRGRRENSKCPFKLISMVLDGKF